MLTWLLQTLGASSFWVGLLVPIREAGALLPQMFAASRIARMSRRKWVWAGGSALKGLAAAGIGLAVLTLDGRAVGVMTVVLLAFLAVARSICSASYKDILGKTVGTSRRGSVTGLAGSISAAGVVAFALLLMSGTEDRFPLVVGAILVGAGLWLDAAALFATLTEEPSKGEGREHKSVLSQLTVLREDGQLVRFITARGFLVGAALAPPFLVLLAGQAGQAVFQNLGALVLALSAAAFLSSYVWGRLSDRSSRRVLIYSGIVSTVALVLAVLADQSGLMARGWAPPAILFLLMLAYHGVRQGRSTHLVDMAPKDRRAEYTAFSNTVIGLILLGSGIFGALASFAGPVWAVALFGAMTAAGTLVATTLEEVQER